MSDKFYGGVLAGSIDVSIPFVLRKTADNTETTGKVAADMTLSYVRQGGVRVAITASDLAAVNSAHSDGGVKEFDATNEPGLYRIDLPDAAVATGADWFVVSVKVAGSYVFHERFALTDADVQTRFRAAVKTNVLGTVGSASTTTSVVTSALDPTAAATDQYKGRVILFLYNTTSANLRGQGALITASTSGGVLTVQALSHAPVSGDTFVIL